MVIIFHRSAKMNLQPKQNDYNFSSILVRRNIHPYLKIIEFSIPPSPLPSPPPLLPTPKDRIN